MDEIDDDLLWLETATDLSRLERRPWPTWFRITAALVALLAIAGAALPFLGAAP